MDETNWANAEEKAFVNKAGVEKEVEDTAKGRKDVITIIGFGINIRICGHNVGSNSNICDIIINVKRKKTVEKVLAVVYYQNKEGMKICRKEELSIRELRIRKRKAGFRIEEFRPKSPKFDTK